MVCRGQSGEADMSQSSQPSVVRVFKVLLLKDMGCSRLLRSWALRETAGANPAERCKYRMASIKMLAVPS